MKVKPLRFTMALILFSIAIAVAVTREPISWWFAVLLLLDAGLQDLMKSMEDS